MTASVDRLVSPRLSFRKRIECRGGSLPLKKRKFTFFDELCDIKSSLVDQMQLPHSKQPKLEGTETATATTTMDVVPIIENQVLPMVLPDALGDTTWQGCHGITTRNNTFCRRKPGHNGSQFCKVHYFQHLKQQKKASKALAASATVATTTAQTTISAENNSTNGQANHQGKTKGTKSLSKKAPAKTKALVNEEEKRASSPYSTFHQDRRYSATARNETRCLATTTRGRPCAYVSVGGTKYCHLHADYDTNPSPRRAGAGSPTNETPSDLTTPTKKETPVSTKPNMDGPKVDTQPGITLLSTIPVDQWTGTRVRITVGPYKERPGTVAKSGNGWVGVTIDGIIDGSTHNRRSFELIVLEKNKVLPSIVSAGSDSEDSNLGSNTKQSVVTPTMPLTPQTLKIPVNITTPSISSGETTTATTTSTLEGSFLLSHAVVSPHTPRCDTKKLGAQ